MKLETFFENFEWLTDAPNAFAKLREIVLQLAVRGKLVPQNSNDEPAINLLKKIKDAKLRLLEEKKIREPKSLPPLKQDEVPYSLPKSWEWVRLQDVQIFVNGYAFKSQEYSSNGVGLVRIGDIQNGEISSESMVFVPSSYLNLLDKRLQVKPGDLIIAMSGATTGKLGFNKSSETFLLNQRVGKLDLLVVEPSYVYGYLTTKVQENLKISSGSAIPNLSTEQINSTEFPLPPLAEQKRIVEKCDRLLILCDEIEKRQQQRQTSLLKMNESAISQLLTAQTPADFQHHWQAICTNFDLLYSIPETIPKLRQAILQLAVQGKLVPQDPSDEPALNLFEEIKARKEALVKEKIIKKPSLLPPLDSDNMPYLLPKNWMWVRLDDISDIGTGSTPLTSNSDYYLDGNIPWITSTVTSREFIDVAETYITETAMSDYRLRLYPPGSLIVALYGQGKTRGQISQLRISATINQACAAIVFFEAADGLQEYIKRVFQKKYDELRELAAGGAQPNLNVGKIKETLIPLPPLAEQKRIVAKVDSLLSLCDALETKLKAARDSSANLMEVAAKQILVV